MLEIKRKYFITADQLDKLNRTGYGEVNYIDYYSDDRQVKGTEDFSLQRWETVMGEESQISYEYWRNPDGGHYTGRDKGGTCWRIWNEEIDRPDFYIN